MEEKYFTKHKSGGWVFDDYVAKNFGLIANKNIPHYEIVLKKCINFALKAFPNNKNIKIVDVGSATGKTLDLFIKSGFKNVEGVESSEAMIKLSKHNEKVTLSSVFIVKEKYFDMIIANWTLHFVKQRRKYMKDIFSSLKEGGYLILTEQISSSSCVHDLYYDFKRKQGVPESEIVRKAAAIKGVLVTKPLSWYLNTLNEIGFSKIEVIDADWCFVSLLCKK